MSHVRGTIDAVAAGKVLSPADDEAFRAHLKACADCGAHFDTTMGVLRLARGGPQAWAPGEAVRLTARAAALARPAATPARTWGRWAVTGGVLAVAALLVVLAWPRAPVGSVLVTGAGFTVDGAPAEKDQALLAGADLATGEIDAAVLLDGKQGRRALLLRPHTRVRLPSADEAGLEAGRVRVQLKAGAPFVLTTPEGATVTSTGGVFVAERRDDGTLVAVHDGAVFVRHGVDAVQVKDGQETQVALSGDVAPARTAGPNALVEDRGDGSVWGAILRFLRGILEAIGRALNGG